MATSHTNVLSLSDSRLRLVAAGLAAGILAAAIGGSVMTERAVAASHPEDPAEHTISVTGTGRIIVSPDIADLRLGVSVTRPTVKAARAEAAQSMTRVLAALRKLGIAERDLQTTLLALQPNYDYSKNENPPRLNGYTLSNAVAVTIRDLDRIGDVIDGALAAGATTLDGVSFRTEDPAAAEQQAREQAMRPGPRPRPSLRVGA